MFEVVEWQWSGEVGWENWLKYSHGVGAVQLECSLLAKACTLGTYLPYPRQLL